MKFLPDAPPKKARDSVERLAAAGGINARLTPVYLVGIRGYYHDYHLKNERGIYDDAIFLVSPQSFASFNANTDPTVARLGIAKLRTGLWLYKLGIHGLHRPKAQQYQALVQASIVTVDRDLTGRDDGWFGINIHRGGKNTTSSLGCQTIPPGQWQNFIGMVRQELTRAGQKTIPYLLTE